MAEHRAAGPAPLRLVVLVSGNGTNLGSILDAADGGRCAARVVAVVADRPGARAIERATSRGIATAVVSPRDFGTREAWDEALADAVAAHAPELVVFAGFMRIVGPGFVSRFAPRIVNVHPSLLPAFPGKDGPAQALRSGARITGCTVHQVDQGVDTGRILAQAAVPILVTDDEARLHRRIQRVEHRLLPAVIDWIAHGALSLEPGARSAGPPAPEDAALLVPAPPDA